jgi:glycine hydroxymethyltransferase|uniref:serine hydroxymethyltransferase n=1 Tax=Candidatus Planktophila sp. TaxID=2175601 RepID=UPI00404A6A2B
MQSLKTQSWATAASQELITRIASQVDSKAGADVQKWIEELAQENHRLHDIEGINLNPATNILNPRAEKLLSSGMGSRASLGHPGDKYETGLGAIEQIEIITQELACEVFGSTYAEFRVPSGAIANLYAFMATTEPHDTIIAPPASIGGHVTHHKGGSAGLYRLNTISAPVDQTGYTIDIDALRTLAHEVKPKLITVGGSLNLFHHPIAQVRAIADEVGAKVLFDAAHLCGMIAGKVWPQPLVEGAHLMTFSTYKSLGGPAGGLIVTNDDEIAQRLDAIAYPGLTANFDAAKTAALGITLQDWKSVGRDYAQMMVKTSQALAQHLQNLGVNIFAADKGFTTSHQFAILAAPYGGGQTAARRMGEAGLLACGIGLPIEQVEGDLNGLRIGTPEIVRIGMKVEDMKDLAGFIARSLDTNVEPKSIQREITEWRKQFSGVHYTVDLPN